VGLLGEAGTHAPEGRAVSTTVHLEQLIKTKLDIVQGNAFVEGEVEVVRFDAPFL